MRALLLTVILTVAAVAVPKFEITITPGQVVAGHAVRVTCKVPRAAGNRFLSIGIADLQSSVHQLDGADAPITHELTVDHVLCDSGPAFCVVVDNEGRTTTRTLPFEILGCNTHP